MKVDMISVIRQDIEYKKSRVLHLQEEMLDKWTSEDSKYITKKDLEQAKLDLQNTLNEIVSLVEELKEEFGQNNGTAVFRMLE